MSQELKFHKHWNITKNKYNKNNNFTRIKTKTKKNKMSKILNFTKKNLCKKNVKKTVMSKKQNCYKNWNITKLKEERKKLKYHKIKKKNTITELPQNWKLREIKVSQNEAKKTFKKR